MDVVHELPSRTYLLDLLETKWLAVWDLRFGQLIDGILNNNRTSKVYFTDTQIRKLNTLEWIDLVEGYTLLGNKGTYITNYQRDPKRIPLVIDLLKREWTENPLSFGEYLHKRRNAEQPRISLYGYEINLGAS